MKRPPPELPAPLLEPAGAARKIICNAAPDAANFQPYHLPFNYRTWRSTQRTRVSTFKLR